FSSRRRHTRSTRDWSSDVCSSDLLFCDSLHRLGRDPLRVEHDCQLVAGQRPLGEDVDNVDRVPLRSGTHRGMTRQVDVPCARSLPELSAMSLPSAVATLPPRCTTTPSARTGPVSAVIARTKLTFVSSVVYRSPKARVVCTAQPIAESRMVIAKPA